MKNIVEQKSEEKACSCLAITIWLTLVAFYFYQFIARSSFITVLTDEFMRYFKIDAAGIGILGSCYYVVYTAMQIPAGMITDRYSTRKTASLATLGCALGLFVLVSVPNGAVAGIGQMIIGFCSSFAFLLIVKAITLWFPSSKVTIFTSCTMSIGCLGPVIGGPAVAYVTRSFNWLNVIMVYAVCGLALAAFIWCVVRDKEKKESDSIEQEQPENMVEAVKRIASNGQIWVLSLLIMAMYSPLSALGDLWGVSFIKVAYGLTPEMSALANNMLYLGVVVGSPVFAYWATAIESYKKPMIVGAFGAFLSLCVIVYLSDYMNTCALFCLFFALGFSCGSMLEYPLGIALFPRSLGATVTGFINMMSMVSGIILMPTIGALIQYSWNGLIENGVEVYSLADYRLGLTSVVLFLGFGVIISFFIKDRSPKNI